jgi:opacity protein-like surface antigen
MSKAFLVGAALFAALTGLARADFYVGADYKLTGIAVTDWLRSNIPQHFDGYALHIGERFSPYYAGELGVESNSGTNGNDHLAIRAITLDGFAYLPIMRGPFSVFATAGGAYNEAMDREIIVTHGSPTVVTPHFDASEFNWRAGAGVEWQTTSDTTLRLTFRYQDYNFSNQMDGSWSAALGFSVSL